MFLVPHRPRAADPHRMKRCQTTVPKAIRQALGVGYGDRIDFRLEDGIVTVHALPEEDPALEPFLNLLTGDIVTRRGEAVRRIPVDLVSRMETLTDEAGEVDPDTPIEGDVV